MHIFRAIIGTQHVERIGSRCGVPAPRHFMMAQGRAEEDRMSLFGKLFRGAAAAATVVLGVNSALAQDPGQLPPAVSGIPGLTAPGMMPETSVEQASGFGRSRCAPGCAPYSPYTPCPPGQMTPPGMPDVPPT